jgi:hypothetical protein
MTVTCLGKDCEFMMKGRKQWGRIIIETTFLFLANPEPLIRLSKRNVNAFPTPFSRRNEDDDPINIAILYGSLEERDRETKCERRNL